MAAIFVNKLREWEAQSGQSRPGLNSLAEVPRVQGGQEGGTQSSSVQTGP